MKVEYAQWALIWHHVSTNLLLQKVTIPVLLVEWWDWASFLLKGICLRSLLDWKLEILWGLRVLVILAVITLVNVDVDRTNKLWKMKQTTVLDGCLTVLTSSLWNVDNNIYTNTIITITDS